MLNLSLSEIGFPSIRMFATRHCWLRKSNVPMHDRLIGSANIRGFAALQIPNM